MKILFVISTLKIGGGAEKQLQMLATALKEKGHTVSVACIYSSKNEKTYDEILQSNGIDIYYLSTLGFKSIAGQILGLIAVTVKFKPEIAISFMAHSILLMRIAGALSHPCKKVDSLRNSHEQRKVRIFLLKLTNFCSSAMIFNSSDISLHLTKAEKTHVIFNMVESKQTFFKQKNSSFQWICVSRLISHKNVLSVFRAFELLIGFNYHAHLSVYGSGPLEITLRNYINLNNLSSYITLNGLTNEVHLALSNSDGFIQLSRWEGMSNSMLEAASVGLPIVVSKVSGVKDIFDDFIDDYVVEPDDIYSAAMAMKRIMDLEPDAQKDLSERIRKSVNDKCNPEKIVKQWDSLLKKINSESANYD